MQSLAQGQVLNNRYRIAKLIGQGGFGAVYRAWDLTLKQPVALKENLDTSHEAQRQFEREATLMASLRHPNLPRVMDHFFIPGQGQYLAMDFVEGQSLAALLAAQGYPFTEAQALPWLEQVCAALDYLHTRQPPIVHRDIKPENIIITPEGQAMLVDFGISKVYDTQLATTVGARAVTPGYSPPEQYGAGKTDARTDIYALGATLYRILTGVEPPPSVDLVAGATSLQPPRQLNKQLDWTTEQAVLQAMAINMSQRFARASDFFTTLTSQSTQVATHPTNLSHTIQQPVLQQVQTVSISSPSDKFWMWPVGGLLLLVLVAGIVWIVGQGQNRNHINSVTVISTPTNTPRSTATPTITNTPHPQPPNQWEYGFVIDSVVADSPANTSGFQAGDIIIAVDDVAVSPESSLFDLIQNHSPGDNASFWVVRHPDVTPFILLATLAEHPNYPGRGYLGIEGNNDYFLERVAIINTPTPAPTLVFMPRSTVSLGRGGWNSSECTVVEPTLSVTQAELFEDDYMYIAMPIQTNDYDEVLLWSVYDPNGFTIWDHIERHLTTDNYDDDCFIQGFTLDFSSVPGAYTVELVVNNTQIFVDHINILEAVIPTPVSLAPIGDFTFGRNGISSNCTVSYQIDRVSRTDLESDHWLYFASTYSIDQIGDVVKWTVYEPDGDVNVYGVRELELQPILCFWQGFWMGGQDPDGVYRLEIEYGDTKTYFEFGITE